MHLGYSTSTYKGKIYRSYTIAKSYRDGKKVRKKTILSLGKLDDKKAEEIRILCKIIKGKTPVGNRFDHIIVKEIKNYLNLIVKREIWNAWHMDTPINYHGDQYPNITALIANILVMIKHNQQDVQFNICEWIKKESFAKILGRETDGLSENSIFQALEDISLSEACGYRKLLNEPSSKTAVKVDSMKYILTVTTCAGSHAPLSSSGTDVEWSKGKNKDDHLLCIVATDDGSSFGWELVKRNELQRNTFKERIGTLKRLHRLEEGDVTFLVNKEVFEGENMIAWNDINAKYIQFLNEQETLSCGMALEFMNQSSMMVERDINADSNVFKQYNEVLYFKEFIFSDHKRYVYVFNPNEFVEKQNHRNDRIKRFEAFIKKKNHHLSRCDKEVDSERLKNSIINELKKLKLRKYYEDPILMPSVSTVSQGQKMMVSKGTCRFFIKKKEDVLKAREKLDGIFVLVTNHTEKIGATFRLKPETIISTALKLNNMDNFFKNVTPFQKTDLYPEPTDEMMKSVYSTYVLSYLIKKSHAN